MATRDVRPPDYRLLADELLIELLSEKAPCRRSAWVGRTAERDSFSVRLQRKLAANPSGLHPTHLRQRLDRTVDWLREQGWVDTPSRGHYVLTAEGRSQALRARRSQRRTVARLAQHARDGSARDPQGERRGADPQSARAGLPAFVKDARVDELGEPYRGRRTVKTAHPEPFAWDADEKDRLTQAHEDVLWRLSLVLAERRIVPRVRNRARPRVDLVFRAGRTVTVVEIKSLPDGGHEHQLRVGLGQVVQYRRELRDEQSAPVRAVLCVPCKPQRADVWVRACADVDVVLLYADASSEELAQSLLLGKRT